MAKPATRIIFLEAVLVFAGAAIVARSFWIQVVHHSAWVEKAGKSRATDLEVQARRGRIYDRNGRVLAVSQEQYRIRISLDQVLDTAALQARLPKLLGVSKPRVDSQFRKSFAYFYGPFGAERVDSLRKTPGVHLDPVYNRVYPVDSLADRMLGRLNERGDSGIEGIEKAFDSLLQGRAGLAHYLVDAKGRRMLAPGPPLREPIAGKDLELTIDSDLQGIAEGALRRAVEANAAHGGDIVIMDVHTGELYAVASVRMDTTHKIVATSSALVEPNQPGSTSKIFTVAAVLRTGADTTPVDGENGHWEMPFGDRGATRPISDVHAIHGLATLGETVKVSSNIAISKFALRLKPNEQYESLRDFGFGTVPGVGFPGEAPGVLRHPVRWVNNKLSMTSLAQGYEWEATAVQLAAGYAAIGNHGVLVTPTLLRRVLAEHGEALRVHRPDTVRAAVADSIARHLMAYLRLTEETGGTGTAAQGDLFRIAGKTGTTKVGQTSAEGYRASYVGLFPDDNPQVVIYIMIDRPNGKNGKFGGTAAAPIAREVFQQALAARLSPLDRNSLVAASNGGAPPPPVLAAPQPVSARHVAMPIVAAPEPRGVAIVPDLVGLSAKQAALALERAGFQIHLVGRARVRSTVPIAGDSMLRGTIITVRADSLR